jgi:hypothetical protein
MFSYAITVSNILSNNDKGRTICSVIVKVFYLERREMNIFIY